MTKLDRLNALRRAFDHEGELTGYAAGAALEVIMENWTAAMRDGATLSELAGDIDRLKERLDEFKAAALA